MIEKNNDLIIGSMSAGRSNWSQTVLWAYHCECGAHYQGVYNKLNYQSINKTLPISKCPKCGKAIDQVIVF